MIKFYKNSNVFILLQGKVNTRFCIDKAIILINKSKLIISNEDMDCTIDLFMVKKIKIEEKLHKVL